MSIETLMRSAATETTTSPEVASTDTHTLSIPKDCWNNDADGLLPDILVVGWVSAQPDQGRQYHFTLDGIRWSYDKCLEASPEFRRRVSEIKTSPEFERRFSVQRRAA